MQPTNALSRFGAGNALVHADGLPDFATLNLAQVLMALRYMLRENRKSVEQILSASGGNPTFENTIEPLALLDTRLDNLWRLIEQLSMAVDSPGLRKVDAAVKPLVARYATYLGQHEGLYTAYRHVRDSTEFDSLNAAQKMVVEKALLGFSRSGIGLDTKSRKHIAATSEQLATNGTSFGQNVLDATREGALHFESAEELAGIPDSYLAQARELAGKQGKAGYVLSLSSSNCLAVTASCDSYATRERFYRAFTTRAAIVDGKLTAFDNTPIMVDTLTRRREMSALLGHGNYAEYALAVRMAAKPGKVLDLISNVAQRARAKGRQELAELSRYAVEKFGAHLNPQTGSLAAWDIAYYEEKMRQEKFKLSQEELRAFFPLPTVLNGLFAIVKRLYGIEIREDKSASVWHPDVRFFQLFDESGSRRAGFFLDPFARDGKAEGAWHLGIVKRSKRADGSIELPVSAITCNFSPPEPGKPALLKHANVITLLHELGHALHSMLSLVEYPCIGGTAVQRDGVELPSQIMENWGWQPEVLPLLSGHYLTGEPLSADKIASLLAAKNFHSALPILKQLELALFDLRLHMHKGGIDGETIQQIFDAAREEVAVVRPPSYNRMQNYFSHIFNLDYEAGYYSYLWAEVLSADAFSAFEASGIFDKATARRFLHSVLEQGGSRDMMSLYVEFRGREPTPEALFRHLGL
jgi:oligopeptidase A